jgi:phosphoglycerate dehydrogenase-like enzyme
MELSRPPLVVAFELSEKRKAIVADVLAGASAVVYLTELDEAARAEALRNTGALLTFNTSKELRSGDAELLDGARLIKFMIAGVDFIPLGELPDGVPVATNGGGYAESMAEHALAMALASVAVKHGAARLFAYWRRCIQPRDSLVTTKKVERFDLAQIPAALGWV